MWSYTREHININMNICLCTHTHSALLGFITTMHFFLTSIFFSNFPYSLLCSRPLHLLPDTFTCLVLAPNEKTKENKLDSALMTFEALFHYYKTEQSL